MKRVIAGIVLAPLFWPWAALPISMLYFRWYTGVDAHYFWITPLQNLHLFGWAYVLMVALCPLVFLLLKRKVTNLGGFLILGAVVGLAAPLLLQVVGPLLFPSAPDAQVSEYRTWSGFAQMAPQLALTNMHTTTASAVATSAMLGIFWWVSVRGNRLFTAQPNNSLNPLAQNRRAG